jgi:hypothetical protein
MPAHQATPPPKKPPVAIEVNVLSLPFEPGEIKWCDTLISDDRAFKVLHCDSIGKNWAGSDHALIDEAYNEVGKNGPTSRSSASCGERGKPSEWSSIGIPLLRRR